MMGNLLMQTIRHHFPDMRERLEQLIDPRTRTAQGGYSIGEIVFAALSMFLLRQPSRNRVNEGRDKNVAKAYRNLFGFRLPHMDTVDNCLRKLDPEALANLRVSMVKTLIASKVLEHGKIPTKTGKSYLVAVDASGVHSSKEEMEGAVFKCSKGRSVTYLRIILEAKIITSTGFAISIASEWIQNPTDEEFDKQDCELKAFKRLSEKIKKFFPRLGICIVADGLYPSETFMQTCKEYGWSYIAVFKDGKIPSLWDQADQALIDSERKGSVNMVFNDSEDGSVSQTIEWIDDLHYRNHSCSLIEAIETADNVRRFVYLTNLPTNQTIVVKIALAGRKRWNIEDAFNSQKNRGFSLEHKFSRVSFRAVQNYYTCLQIAYLIDQLMTLSQHFKKLLDHAAATVSYMWVLLSSALIFLDEIITWPQRLNRTKFCYL
jgi:predicted  nucleic acid-binding Zn-ribbon protein